MDLFTSLALTVVLMAVGFWILYLVVRSAVLWALREHAREQGEPARRSDAKDAAAD